MARPRSGVGGEGEGEGAAEGGVEWLRIAFDGGEGRGQEHQEREVDGEGVVLLVGGDGEEDEDEGGEDDEEKDGLRPKAEAWGYLFVGGEIDEGFALAAGDDEGGGGEEAPGEEPDQVEGPVEVAGELVVVAGDAAAEEAEDVLVDEVEPEEAVAVGAAGVAQAGEDVPRGGYGEEEKDAGEGLERAPAVELVGPEEEEKSGGEDEDDGDEAFGEDGEGEGGPHQVGPDGGWRRPVRVRRKAVVCYRKRYPTLPAKCGGRGWATRVQRGRR